MSKGAISLGVSVGRAVGVSAEMRFVGRGTQVVVVILKQFFCC